MNIVAPSLADIDEIAREALKGLPEPFARYIRDVVVHVTDFPDEAVCAEMDLENPFDILGLYQGIALDEKTTDSSATLPDMVFLYRRPILDFWCESGLDLHDVVRHVMVHEIGHHFGLSDAEMEAIVAEEERGA